MEFSTIKLANWLDKLSRVPNFGDKRMKSAFLLLPKVINHRGRWLVKAKWEEEYCKWIHETGGFLVCGWVATKWL